MARLERPPEATNLATAGAANRQLLHYLSATGKFAYRDPFYVDITDFGGKADSGTTDHGPIAQALYDAFGAGTHIRFPAPASGGGAYYGIAANNAPAIIVNADNCGMFGDGPMSKVRQTGTGGNLLRVNPTSDTTNATIINRFRLANLDADHQGYATSTQAGGINGCFVLYQVYEPTIENVNVDYAHDVGFAVQGCFNPTLQNLRVNDVAWGLGANAFNLSGSSAGSFSGDWKITNLQVTGSCDIAVSTGPYRTSRLAMANVTIDGSKSLRTINVTIGAGTNALTLDSGALTARDVGRLIRIPSGNVGNTSYVQFRVASVTDTTHGTIAATTGPGTAAFAVANKAAQIGLLNGGVCAEGSVGTSDNITVVNAHVDTFWNVGLGAYETSVNSTVKHRYWSFVNCSATNGQAGSTGMWLCGRHMSATNVKIIDYNGTGIQLGAGGDWDEYDFSLSGITVTATASATGSGLRVLKSGTLTSYLRDISIQGRFYGNAGGSRGISIEGRVRDFNLLAGSKVKDWALSGVATAADNGSSPSNVIVHRGVDVRNNNRSSSGTTAEQAGVSLQAGDNLQVFCRITDDQGLIAPYNLRVTTSGSGSSFAGGTQFWWTVTALNAAGETVGSNEVTTTPAVGVNAVLTWSPVHNATSYKVYRATSAGAETSGSTLIATVAVSASPTSSPTYTDTGSAASASAAPSSNTTGTATQLKALYNNAATRIKVGDGADFRGPWQNPLSGNAPPSGSIYEGVIETDDPYVMWGALSGGSLVCTTSAARFGTGVTASDIIVSVVATGGTVGAYSVVSISGGASSGWVSFQVKSTQAGADTSTIKVRVR